MRVRHILVTTDLSPASALSYPHAAGLARAFAARVTLLSVDELASTIYRESAEVKAWFEHASELRRQKLSEASHVFEALGIEPELQIVPGYPATEILGFAKREAVDLIVMTRHGQRVTGNLLGSNTRRVVRQAECPVLVIHEPETYAAPPSEEAFWYQRILAASDLGEESAVGVSETAGLAHAYGARVCVAHAWRSFESVLPATGPALPPVVNEDEQRRREKALEAWLDEAGVADVDTSVVAAASPAEGIIESALAWDADLITISSRGRGAVEAMVVGSVTERLLRLSPLPVLVFPSRWLGVRQLDE